MSKERKPKLKGHLLYNALPHVWKEIRRDNKITGVYKKKAAYISWMVFYVMRPLVWLQKFLFEKEIKEIDINKQPPIFILGHWRSGTTHLHYLMHNDPQFGTLSNYQSFLFNIALLSKSWVKFVLSPLMPETRPQDNVKVDADLPAEEEQPLSVMSTKSGFHTWSFPSNRSYFNKFNIFEGISAEEKAAWQKDYNTVLQNITFFNDGKPLVLKNPHNTSRVKELLELYPNAKFIFIHRNPYDVFVSTRHLIFRAVRAQFLEFVSHEDIEDMIFYFFEKTLKKYLAERDLIPKGSLIEVSFDDMEYRSAEQMERIYKELNISGYENAKPHFDQYLASVKNYKKNQFRNLPPEIEKRIQEQWGFAFEAWGYSKD